MKINSTNAYSFIQHTKLLAYLSGKEEVDTLRSQACTYEGERVYEKLARIESKLNNLATRECNGDIEDENAQPVYDRAKKTINELLPRLKDFGGFFFNGDPRGYTLKVKDEVKEKINGATGFRMFSDFGGYGILAPEF